MRPKNFESSPRPEAAPSEAALLHDGDQADFHSIYKSEHLLPYDQLERGQEVPYTRPEKHNPTELKSIRIGEYTLRASQIRLHYLRQVPQVPEGATQADFGLAAGE